jgi:hypothetical protein
MQGFKAQIKISYRNNADTVLLARQARHRTRLLRATNGQPSHGGSQVIGRRSTLLRTGRLHGPRGGEVVKARGEPKPRTEDAAVRSSSGPRWPKVGGPTTDVHLNDLGF